ncbi:MAG: efflux RND transporter periplasmic adaptor subunit [Myxococcales bacterium]|nr:efflux RND transporter periplasmic adaptor subunit [Myxococcales bacterium]MCB9708993.1 efflux RND transporter periplasmic adaptor subunit [Myxococcales bacterium]
MKARAIYLKSAALLLALSIGCPAERSKTAASKGKPRKVLSFPVEVKPLRARQVSYTITAVGSVEAYERVQITARVSGVVERVRFREGDTVSPGKVLAEIEPQKYALQVEAARAALAKSQAARAEAQAGLLRREAGLKKSPGLIPAEELETWRTKGQVSEADASAAQAELRQAALNLRDAYVRSPIAGTIETRSVETGQYVNPGSVLATLVQREPLLLRFQVTDQEASRLSNDMEVNFVTKDAKTSYRAKIVHVSQAADATSRLIPVVAEVDSANSDSLRPGTFAEVTVPIGAAQQALVVPQTAIRPSERGFIAYIVKDNIAHERILTLGMRTADGHVEIREGLNPGDLLVVRGAEALRDGVKVTVSR